MSARCALGPVKGAVHTLVEIQNSLAMTQK